MSRNHPVNEALREPSDKVFNEETPIVPGPDRAARLAIDTLIREDVLISNAGYSLFGAAEGLTDEQVELASWRVAV